MWIGFSFSILQASGKTPRVIDKLQISHIGLDKISAASRKNHPESLSIPTTLDISIFEILLKEKSSTIVELE